MSGDRLKNSINLFKQVITSGVQGNKKLVFFSAVAFSASDAIRWNFRDNHWLTAVF